MSYRARSMGSATAAAVAGFKGLDDDHTPAAARTSVPLGVFVTIFGAVALAAARRGGVGYAEEPVGQCDIAGAVGMGKKAVVTDAVKSVGQHVDQEAADELVGVERHQLVAGVALGPVILHLKVTRSPSKATSRLLAIAIRCV